LDFQIACTCGQNMIVESQHVGQDVQCPGCGALLTVPPVPRSGDPVPVVWPRSKDTPPEVVYEPTQAQTEYAPFPSALPRIHRKAIASLVCGIIGPFACPPVFGVAALALATQAKLEIRMRPDLYSGLSFATAGQILGLAGLLITVGWWLVGGCGGFLRGLQGF